MVLDDVYLTKSKPSKPRSSGRGAQENPDLHHTGNFHLQLATPQDRLAALSADLVLFLPIVMLFLAPLRRMSLENQILGIELDWVRIFAVGIVMIVAVAYQTISIMLWSATPGKLFIGLKIRSLWHDEKPTGMQAFLRSLLHTLQVLLLGAPWIALFSNPRRRVLHDRASDTIVVVTNKRKGAGPPHPFEMSMASGMQFAILTSLMIFTIFQLRGNDSTESAEGRTESQLTRELESSHVLCRIVGEAHRDWLSLDEAKSSTRVEAALALFAAGVIESDCLEKEADFVLWRKSEKQEAYLAKALANRDNSELLQSYEKKICIDSNSNACQVLQEEIHAADSGDANEQDEPKETSGSGKSSKTATRSQMNSLFELANQPGQTEYVRAFAIRNLFLQNDLKRTLILLQNNSPHYLLGGFYSSIRAKAFYLVHQDSNSMQSLRSSFDGLTVDQRQETSAWFCYAQTLRGCEATSKLACDMHLQFVKSRPESVAQDRLSVVASIRANQCWPDQWSEAVGTLQPLVSQELAQLMSVDDLKDEKERAEKLLEFLRDEPTSENLAVRAEAQRRLLIQDLEQDPQVKAAKVTDMKVADVNDLNLSDEGSLEWVELKRLEMQILEDKGQAKKAWQVGNEILETDPFYVSVSKRMVVLGDRLGMKADVQRLVRELAAEIDDPRLDFARVQSRRLPASFSDSRNQSGLNSAQELEFQNVIKGLKP